MFLRKEKRYLVPTTVKGTTARFFGLLHALVVRELKGRYRRSILGPAWAIIQPLFYMVIFTFLRGIFQISSEGTPYVIFTYSALVPWTFFSNAITRCGPSISANASVVKKIAISREVFPLSGVIISLVDFCMASIILVGMMIWFQAPVSLYLLWVPVLVLLTAFLALGVGLGVSALGTYKHDIVFAMPFFLQFWLLGTPVMYPFSQVPAKWQTIYSLNPMVGIIEGFRTVIITGATPDMGLLFFSLCGTCLVWIVTWPLFRYTSQYVADVL